MEFRTGFWVSMVLEILQYEFAQNALIAGLFASIACAVIGTFVVANRMVSLSGALAHISFGGIGLGYYLKVDPIMSAIPFCVSSSLIIGYVQQKVKHSPDTIIGIMWAVGMALGIMFVHFSQGYAPDLMSYIFGNILTVSSSQLVLMGAMLLVIMAAIAAYYQKLKVISFDEDFAEASGIDVFRYRLLLLALTSLSIILLIKIVGIILVIALLSIPAEIARMFSPSLEKMMAIAAGASIILTLGGIIASFYFDLPSGASIVLLMGAAYIAALGISKKQKNTK